MENILIVLIGAAAIVFAIWFKIRLDLREDPVEHATGWPRPAPPAPTTTPATTPRLESDESVSAAARSNRKQNRGRRGILSRLLLVLGYISAIFAVPVLIYETISYADSGFWELYPLGYYWIAVGEESMFSVEMFLATSEFFTIWDIILEILIFPALFFFPFLAVLFFVLSWVSRRQI